MLFFQVPVGLRHSGRHRPLRHVSHLTGFAYFDVNLMGLFAPPPRGHVLNRITFTEQVMGFPSSDGIGGLLIALQPGLAREAGIFPGNSTIQPPFLVFVTRLFFFFSSRRRCVRTRATLSHAGQVTSEALSNVGVAITRRLADMR